ncbi:hypothetical protein AB0P21_26780 [Kribbella sp. NPDC056861]|uniref:membrane protein YczE n=1 Tax=Kribbella sp. NPDC056861 TaxID=3154857 RepID=UPI003412184C
MPITSPPGSLRLPSRLGPREQLRAGRLGHRLPQLLIGLIGYGASVMMLVQSGLGAASWTVLSEGVSAVAGISLGWATNLIALTVMFAWIPIRELPGLGTLLNVCLVGFAADATALVLPPADSLPVQLAYLFGGVLALSFFDALYLGSQFGSGPRDGIMTGLVRVTGRPIAVVRTVIEVLVATSGWLLGGTLGLGTVVIALSMGPLVGFFLPRVTVRLAAR